MKEINEKDIPKLKHILERIRKESKAYPESLKPFYNEYKDQITEFNRLGALLGDLGVCIHEWHQMGHVILSINEKTPNFDLDKYVDDFNKQKAREDREERKSKYDYSLKKWQYWTFWPVFALGLFGGIYSAVDLFSSKENKNFITNEQLEIKLDSLQKATPSEKIQDTIN